MASYSYNENLNSFELMYLNSTLAESPYPEEYNRENTYKDMLKSSKKYSLSKDTLRIYCSENVIDNEFLFFERQKK